MICGGESGPHARPMHPAWARSLRDQCVAAGVPFFMKQNGEYLALSNGAIDGRDKHHPHCGSLDGNDVFYRVGKKASGALLDGCEWREFPARGETDAR